MTSSIQKEYMFSNAQDRAYLNVDRAAAASAASSFRELGDETVACILVSILESGGTWNFDACVSLMMDYDVPQPVAAVKMALGELCKAGAITNASGKPEFSDGFMSVLMDNMDEYIATIPARMKPFTTHPGDWTAPIDSALNIKFVKTARPEFLQHMTVDRMPLVYEAVNKLQAVAYELNPAVFMGARFLLEGVEDKQQRLQLSAQIALARSLCEEDSIYFLNTLDYRGRLYMRGGILQPQGTDFAKACFRFKDGVALGERGMDALAIHYANCAGYDKLSIDDRLKWAYEHGARFAKGIMAGDRVFWDMADKPFQCLTAAAEWSRILLLIELGEPAESIMSRLVCHQDGTCNGLQHGAAVTGHRPTAEAVNCTASCSSDVPSDVYGRCANELVSNLHAGNMGAIAKIFEAHGRKACKLPVMITAYGAGISAAMSDLMAVLSPEERAICEPHISYISNALEDALVETAGGIVRLTDALKEAMESTAANRIAWRTEDGFFAAQALAAKKPSGSVPGLAAADEREYVGVGSFKVKAKFAVNIRRQLAGLSPNFVHSIDANHLRNVVRATDASLVTVHDSYGSHAGSYFEVAAVIREQFVVVHEYEWLEALAGSNEGCNAELLVGFKKGDFDAAEVLRSEYFFS